MGKCMGTLSLWAAHGQQEGEGTDLAAQILSLADLCSNTKTRELGLITGNHFQGNSTTQACTFSVAASPLPTLTVQAGSWCRARGGDQQGGLTAGDWFPSQAGYPGAASSLVCTDGGIWIRLFLHLRWMPHSLVLSCNLLSDSSEKDLEKSWKLFPN